MTIYIDILFFTNFIADLAIGYTAMVFADEKIKKIRLILAALTGAVYGILAVLFPFFSVKIILLCFIMLQIYIIFGKISLRKVFIYATVTILARGICSIFYSASNTLVGYRGDNFFPATDFSLYLSILVFSLTAGHIKKFFSYRKLKYDIIIKNKSKVVTARALYDSGNTLCYRGTPVVMVERDIFNALCFGDDFPIEYKTVSDIPSYTPAIHIDEIYFPNEDKVFSNLYVGIANLDGKSFNVLMHRDIHP